MRKGQSRSRTGVQAAIAAIAIAVGLGVVGVAGADEQSGVTVYASEQGSWCFTEDAVGKSCDAPNAPVDVTIQPGDTVTWDFTGATTAPHNAASTSSNWTFSTGPLSQPHTPTTPSFTFTQAGDYTFACQLHGNMQGTIRVAGGTATPTPTPTPSPQPSTPPPAATTDTVKPTVRSVKATALKHAVRVQFRLSEPATVTVKIKRRGSRKVLKSASVQARAGTRTVTLRSKRLEKGRYTVEIQARDAYGNRSSLAAKRLTLRK
jgi:plastocyanin